MTRFSVQKPLVPSVVQKKVNYVDGTGKSTQSQRQPLSRSHLSFIFDLDPTH